MRKLHVASVSVAMALFIQFAHAQNYPSKPVRLVTPNTAGSPADVLFRQVAEQLQERFGQAFVVDSRAGAGGAIAMENVSRSAPDGYTLLACSDAPLTVSPSVYTNLPVVPLRDFAPVAIVADSFVYVLVVNPATAKSLKEFISYAKQHSGSLSYGSAGHGSGSNMMTEIFKEKAGLSGLQHVPHKGLMAAATEVVAKRLDMYIGPDGVLERLIRSGSLIGLATSGAKRSPLLPEVPTFAEAGLPGYVPPVGWIGILAPAKTPDAIVTLLNREISRITRTPKIVEIIAKLGGEPASDSAAEFKARLQETTKYWAAVVRDHGIKGE